MRNKSAIYRGFLKPDMAFVGRAIKAKPTHDQFGILPVGYVRQVIIDTRWGQLTVPQSWIDRKIEITVRTLNIKKGANDGQR